MASPYSIAKRLCRSLLGSTTPSAPKYPYDLSELERSLYERVENFTMTGPIRVSVLSQAVTHIHQSQIPGDIVECGVWKGGSSMAAAIALLQFDSSDRTLWLYDTFDGMSDPSENDRSHTNESAKILLEREDKENPSSVWCFSPLEEVEQNLFSTGYPREKLRFVQGKVEDTIPEEKPEKIALLRLDTDWYESTLHELRHLYPLLSPGGILIIDDYGYWEGARRAVDEYFASLSAPPFLARIDNSSRIAVKPGDSPPSSPNETH